MFHMEPLKMEGFGRMVYPKNSLKGENLRLFCEHFQVL